MGAQHAACRLLSFCSLHGRDVSAWHGGCFVSGPCCSRVRRSGAYVYRQLCEAYPVLDEQCRLRVDSCSKGRWQDWKPKATLAWGFHLEAINLCVRHVFDGRDAANFHYLWVIEDDVGFTGALEELCAAYVEEAADLIGAAPVPVHAGAAEDADNSWCWTHMGSDAFLAAVPLALRLKAAEHVQRFSRRALDAMHALATGAQRLPSSGGQLPRRSRRRALTVRGEGATLGTSTPSTPPIDGKPAYRTSECVSAWSEMAAPTLCERLGMAFVPLKAIHIGSVYSYDGRMSQQGWMVATREERGNFFHALKW